MQWFNPQKYFIKLPLWPYLLLPTLSPTPTPTAGFPAALPVAQAHRHLRAFAHAWNLFAQANAWFAFSAPLDLVSRVTFSVTPFWMTLSNHHPHSNTHTHSLTQSPFLALVFHLTCYVIFLFNLFILSHPIQEWGQTLFCSLLNLQCLECYLAQN